VLYKYNLTVLYKKKHQYIKCINKVQTPGIDLADVNIVFY